MDKRDSILRLQMDEREKEFTMLQNFKIFMGTWNVNGQSASESLVAWLGTDSVPPDLYAVGFQELDLSKEAFLFADSPREPEWARAVAKGLHPGAKYQEIRRIRLVGMMLLVFVKQSLVSFIHDVHAQTVGTGLMGTMGNKGGVAVSLKFHNTSVCFVNSHLAAHTHEYERRNQDFRNINARMFFVPDPLDPSRNFDIDNHDVVMWLGDLNYRLKEGTYDLDRVKTMIEQRQFELLLELDQLRLSRRMKMSFQGYKEAEIHFPPTYKFDPGTDNFDSSEKARFPAWCDRVLWKSQGVLSRRKSHSSSIAQDAVDEEMVRQLTYRSHPMLKLSDHKPVSALFDVKVKVVDQKKQKKVFEEIMKHLDKLENDYLPQVECDSLELNFEEVTFMEPAMRSVGITNTGQVPVQYSFINRLKPSSQQLSKPWLRIRNASDIIMPGSKHFIEVEVLVDEASAAALTYGRDKLEEILILHLENGRDIFLIISGFYRPSCFGCDLWTLCHSMHPIKDLSIEQLIELSNSQRGVDIGMEALSLSPPEVVNGGAAPPQHAYDIPKELWVMVDHIFRHGIEKKDLFDDTSGDPSDFIRVRDFLDSYTPEKDLPSPSSGFTVDAVAFALSVFLKSLPEPIIPFRLYDKCLQSASNANDANDIIQQLPSFHRSSFQYLVAFINELLHHRDKNELDRTILATVFGEMIIRSPNPERDVGQHASLRLGVGQKKMKFLSHFLDNDVHDLNTY